MPTLPIYQVDAFTDRPFAGNPAAVCPLEAPIAEALMQEIAAENNLSETAFLLTDGDAFGLRWFTPTVEVDLCGHATLATAFVLMTEIEPARNEVTFRTRSGLLPVRRGDGGQFVLDFPTLSPTPVDPETAARVARMLDTQPTEVLRAPVGTLLAVLADAGEVRRAKPDLAAVAQTGTSLCITAPGPDPGPDRDLIIDFVSRYFAPAHGIPEDPVTGSAHCILTPYWAARLGKRALRARQVSRRGGELSCTLAPDRVAGDRVLIGGQARLVITGTLRY
jgi:PhzF family phenazine biosynthesis protein